MSEEGWSPVETQLDHGRTEPEPCPSTALLPAAAPPVPSLGQLCSLVSQYQCTNPCSELAG